MYYEKVNSDAESSESTPLNTVRQSRDRDGARPSSYAALRLQIITVCLAYAIVGPTLVIINNHILKSLSFPFPLFLSALGLITTSFVCAFTLHVLPRLQRRLAQRQPARAAANSSPDAEGGGINSPRLPPAEPLPLPGIGSGVSGGVTLNFWLRNMIPIGAAQGLTFASTNAAYMYLTITFTQMLAAFTPTVTLVLLYLFRVEIPTARASVCVLVIGLGCALSSYGEGHFNIRGVMYRSLGIFSEATRLVLTQHLLKNHKLSVFESQYYLAPVGAGFLLVGALFSESGRFYRMDGLGTILAHPMLFTASAVLGVIASMLTFLVIKLTNSVTLKVINTARNAAFVLFTVTLLGEEATGIQLCGYTVSLCAFSAYTYTKIYKL